MCVKHYDITSQMLKKQKILTKGFYTLPFDYSFFGSTADFVIKKEDLGFSPDVAISKRQKRQVEIWP